MKEKKWNNFIVSKPLFKKLDQTNQSELSQFHCVETII